MVEQDDPSSPGIADDQRRAPGSSEGLGAQGYHGIHRSVTVRLKRLGLLAGNRAVKEWHIAEKKLRVTCRYAGRRVLVFQDTRHGLLVACCGRNPPGFVGASRVPRVVYRRGSS